MGIDLGVYGLPETFLIDERGFIVYKHIGAVDGEIWASEFLPIIERLRSGGG